MEIPEHVRGWIYRVFTAVTVLAVFYGIATEAEVATWATALTAILGNSLATRHTARVRAGSDA